MSDNEQGGIFIELPCVCDHARLRAEFDKGDKELIVMCYVNSAHSHIPLWDKLKMIWKIITKGDIGVWDIILNEKDFIKLKDKLNNIYEEYCK